MYYLTMEKYGIHMFSNESFYTRWVGLSQKPFDATFPLRDSQTVYRRLKRVRDISLAFLKGTWQ
jgi:hypothetical protein